MSRITVVQFDYTVKPNTIKLLRTDNGYKQTISLDDKQAMHRQAWYVMHSPKLLALTIKTSFYSKDIASMISYAEMIGVPVDVCTPNGKFHTSREFLTWYQEQAQAEEEHMLSVENINLLVKHAPELLRYAKISSDELIRVLREQIRLSGYDVDMQSVFITDGLNSGVVEDGKGRHEWSRSYTKHYERYDRTLKDLLLMYISCKFYRSAGFEQDAGTEEVIVQKEQADAYKFYKLAHEKGYDISLDRAKAYTATYNMDLQDTVVVVPRSACSLSVQNKMN